MQNFTRGVLKPKWPHGPRAQGLSGLIILAETDNQPEDCQTQSAPQLEGNNAQDVELSQNARAEKKPS